MSELTDLVAAELAQPVDLRVAAMAAEIAAQYPGAARAVLFYGSCLRADTLDGLMLDFYLIVSSYEAAYGKTWLAAANRLIPPNVFPWTSRDLSAKFAVLSEADLARECGETARSVSVWARFAQPARLVWTAGPSARAGVVASVSTAATTLLASTLPMMAGATMAKTGGDRLDVWKRGFALTYAAELRAERGDRSASVVDADPDRYRRFGAAAMREIGARTAVTPEMAARRWRKLQRRGKWLSVLRLAKASFTFAGGVDYLAWKVSRHSGQAVVIRPWHRRLPLLAAIILLPRLLARGAVR